MYKLIRSKSTNPARNLAYEEYLIEQKEPVIFLWINEPTVVIGRNQNPYKECDLKKMNENKVHLMRRRSGGGAVYHDLGNINFTIISKKTENIIEENFELVKKVLALYGIKADVSGRNDLEVDGRKISGSAFFEDEDIYCHHGTLLVNTNMEKLGQYLVPSKLKLESKGIDSVRSRVANLCEFKPGITTQDIIDGFAKICGCEIEEKRLNLDKNPAELNLIINKYNSWDWIYGDTIEYNVTLKNKFSWGLIEVDLSVDKGLIQQTRIYTDSIINDRFKELEEALVEVKFDKESVQKEINKTIKSKQIIDDLNQLFDVN